VITAVQYAAAGCVVAGFLAGALALLVGCGIRTALRIALDLWLAAGLLRLALPSDGTDILAAAAIVVVRQLVILAVRGRRPARRPTDDDRQRGPRRWAVPRTGN
jgi:hypothetical protein